MTNRVLAAVLALGLVACTSGAAKDVTDGTANGAADARRSDGARTARSLASGTRVEATIQDALSSRTNKPGETLHATVSHDVMDSRGRVVIPSGSSVSLTIDKLEPGSDEVRPEGRLSLIVTSVSVNGEEQPITAELEPVAHHMQGRGVTTDEAARVGAGAAIGAVAGQLIGKNTRSTVIGGAVGTVAGGAVAVRYAYRDVIVSAGTPIAFTLSRTLNLSAR